MSAVAAVGRRYLPRGWTDLVRQLVIWFGFVLAYQVARGLADRNPARAFENGLKVIEIEQRWSSQLVELSLQQLLNASDVLRTLAAWTYWNSEFTVIGLSLLWVYLRRHESFARLRNTVLLANVLGLFGYVLAPTAPPRMFPSFGFLDTMSSMSGVNHGSGLVQLAANPYAAMPSLHAADALIVGVVLAGLSRRWPVRILWLLWPVWIWFTIMATANHFLLDVVAGIALALLALAIVYRERSRRIIARLL